MWFQISYLAIATFGAYSTDVWLPSVVLAVRVGILALTVVMLARTYPAEELMRSWFSAVPSGGSQPSRGCPL